MSDQAAGTAAPHTHSSSAGMIIGLLPWVVFTLLAEHGTLKLASIASLVIAGCVCVYSSRGGHRPKMIEVAAVATFIVFTIIAFVADPSVTHWLTRYARAIAAATLAVLVFASLLFVPFTEEYAREQVPKEYWGSAQFKAVNRKLTAIWGGVFAVMTGSHVIGGIIDKTGTNIIFNWVIPIGLILWGTKQSQGEKHTAGAQQPA